MARPGQHAVFAGRPADGGESTLILRLAAAPKSVVFSHTTRHVQTAIVIEPSAGGTSGVQRLTDTAEYGLATQNGRPHRQQRNRNHELKSETEKSAEKRRRQNPGAIGWQKGAGEDVHY